MDTTDKLYHSQQGRIVEDFGRLVERWVRQEPKEAKQFLETIADWRALAKAKSPTPNVKARIPLIVPSWINDRMEKLHFNYLKDKQVVYELMTRFPIFKGTKEV